jgi:glutathionylspermidine synthase
MHNSAHADIVGRGLDNETPASAKDNNNIWENMMEYEVRLVVTYDGAEIDESIIQALEDASIKVDFMSIVDASGEFHPEFMSVEA